MGTGALAHLCGAAVYNAAGTLLRVIEGTPTFEDAPVGAMAAFSLELPELEVPPTHYALYFTDLR